MKCTEFEKIVNAYVDDELNQSTKAIEEHIKSCESCQQLYQETLDLKSLLSELEPVELPEDFEATLHEKLVAVTQEKKVLPFYRRTKGIQAFASFAAVAVISVLAFRAGTLMPSSDNNENAMLYGNVNELSVSMNEPMSANDMAMAEDFDMEAETTYTMSDDMDDADMDHAEEVMENAPAVGFAKETRVTLTSAAYAEEDVNYILSSDTTLTMVTDFVIDYELRAYEQLNDYQISFYITDEEFEIFKAEINKSFNIESEVVLEYTPIIEDVQVTFSEQLTIVDFLKNAVNAGESDEEELASEEEKLNELQEEVDRIEALKHYKRITINISKE